MSAMEEHYDAGEAPPEDAQPESSPISSAPTTTKPLTTSAVIDATLHFFANASNETLGACAVGLCASTYLVLGRVGLVLIGAVGGIVLHATWESQQGAGSDGDETHANRRKKELGIEVAHRILDWRDRRKTDKEKDDVFLETTADLNDNTKTLDYSDFPPETGVALTNFTDAVIRDYVKWWYSPILPKDQSFPASCRQTLTKFITSFSRHLSRKRTADPFLDFLSNSTSIVIVFLNELSSALKSSPNSDAETAIETYLQFQPESHLANVLSKEQQERKLALVADDILQNFLDPKAYNCPPVKIFLRETLAGLVLETTVDLCSKPEWINGWIVYLLEEGEPEIMNAIDAGVEDMSGAMSKTGDEADSDKKHGRRVSRAEEAMQEAMREAQRLNEMIAEDEARRKRGLPPIEHEETSSVATTDVGLATPTSSDSDRNRQGERSMDASLVFDIDGNAVHHSEPSSNKGSAPATPSKEHGQFTQFEQLGENVLTPPQPVSSAPAPVEVMMAVPLTLQNASITILDLGDGNEKVTMRQKPNSEYLLQIEPASQRFPGWMVTRRYTDFEPLHQTLTTIARITGVPEFGQLYPALPGWKGQTSVSLIQSLEKFLRFCVKYESLAETEVMKKFLDKETGLQKAPAQSKNVLVQGGAALENVGKNFINVLGQGGKGIAGGGKAVLGGVQGVFGAVAGPKKQPGRPSQQLSRTNTASSTSNFRYSQEGLGESTDSIDVKPPPLPTRPSTDISSPQRSRSSLALDEAGRQSEEGWALPPPPSVMSDDYHPITLPRLETPARPRQDTVVSHPASPAPVISLEEAKTPQTTDVAKPSSRWPKKDDAPIAEEETRICIELIFAILTELYTLAGAWSIRMSLLGAARTFLLRPNNPQLESIRVLLQESVIEANFSDKGIAAHINKMRENTLPTPEEMAKWPAELTLEEKEKLKIKARKLLVERGMPQALTSVMGAAASGEALGRVFDCLQIQHVARGLIFALLLQAIRATTQ
ncbi:PXA domain-containing protein [Exophiala viscosa]|uniref:PXA domain-containing protein n=1 Tax=Exophiala viscosa TaxID=2486360 RepID=A0AAN6DRH1_9EURO|nr:PXA domain-containing protein [Exophiala viscosa]